MSMDWTARFLEVARRISADRGVTLVALVLRDDVAAVASTSASGITERWDLLVSASWFSTNQRLDLDYLVNLVRAVAGAEELIRISRILLLKPTDALVERLAALVKPGVEITRIASPVMLLGMARVRDVIVFTPKAPAAVGTKRGVKHK